MLHILIIFTFNIKLYIQHLRNKVAQNFIAEEIIIKPFLFSAFLIK